MDKVCDFCGCLYSRTEPCDCQDVELDQLMQDSRRKTLSLSQQIKRFIPQRRKMDDELDQDRFELFYKKIRETFELMYRFAFFSIVAFFAVNLVILLTSITFIFLLLTINHMIVPLARTAGLY